MGLLLPAVMSARASARRAQCTNNQHELALALAQYENAKDHLPGYINTFGDAAVGSARFGSAGNLSWAVMIFSQLGQPDLWQRWRDPNVPLSDPNSGQGKYQADLVDIPQLKCPADAFSEPAPLSYVVNCGIEAGTTVPHPISGNPIPESAAHGLFQNRMGSQPIAVNTDRITDGRQHTLLLSENIQATSWAPPLIDPSDPANTTWTGLVDPVNGPDGREGHVGMVWAPGVPSAGSCRPINGCKDAVVDLGSWTPPFSSSPANPPVLQPPYQAAGFMGTARPSSNHPGGVVVTYADGHQDFLGDDVDYEVFQRQMAPEDQQAGLPTP
jgi:hypothetical protein